MTNKRYKSGLIRLIERNKKITVVLILLILSILIFDYVEWLLGAVIPLILILALLGLLFYWGIYKNKKIKIRNLINSLHNSKSKVNNFLIKIPKLIWGSFAVLGILSIGIVLGYQLADSSDSEFITPEVYGKDAEYYDIILTYEDLNKQFFLMMQDMEIVADYRNWENDPERVFAILENYRRNREQILFDQGILYEKKQKANLSVSQEEL